MINCKMMVKRPKVLGISSGGGHWVQLLRLRPAFEGTMPTSGIRNGRTSPVRIRYQILSLNN